MSRQGSPRESASDPSPSDTQDQLKTDEQSDDRQDKVEEQTPQTETLAPPVLPTIDTDENDQQEPTDRNDQEETARPQITETTTDETQEKAEYERETRIPDDFFYEDQQIRAKPISKDEQIFPLNTLSMYRSYGYDCNRRGNLHILDNKTVMFVAGSVVEIIDLASGEHTYIGTVGGYSVGTVVVHPSKKYFAVGEKGHLPNIVIYEYPSLKPYRILKTGTQRAFAYLDFNIDGDLLASLGSSPDYMLTIWDWKNEKILLRNKASSQEVFKVSFSQGLKGQLTTSGIGHIKFWKMARTFTGLKLQGELGRFGRTEISDIEGYRELPDGKVISGSEWGNMLLWDGGLIQIEVCRKKSKACHNGAIQQILLNESDVYTVGEDGYIRVWDFETIDTAEATDEGSKMEMEPLNELRVGTDSRLLGITRGIADDMSLWFAQDAKGNVWKLDLTFSRNSVDPETVLSFLSGPVTGLDVSPIFPLFTASAGDAIRVNNMITQAVVGHKKFNTNVTSLKWLPKEIDEAADTILAGFADGVLRALKLRSTTKSSASDKKLDYDLRLSQVFKPHTKPVTHLAVDTKRNCLATGSDDGTVFFFTCTRRGLKPIGFVYVKEKITFMSWTPREFDKTRLLVCLNNGTVMEFESPGGTQFDTSTTFLIESQLSMRIFRFRSIKSRLRHEEELERKRKEEEERQRKLEEERRLRGIEKKEGDKPDPAAEEEETKKEEDDWKPYIPEVPNAALFAVYTSPDTFWLSMDDYDAGYLYHCQFGNKDDRFQYNPERQDVIVNTLPVPETDFARGDDIPLTSFFIRERTKMIMVGLRNGFVRIFPYGDGEIFQSLDKFWTRGCHDTETGAVTHLAMSFDDRFAFSAGADGNIFGYVIKNDPNSIEIRAEPILIDASPNDVDVEDIVESKRYSIEEDKQKAEQDKMKKSAETLKNEMRQMIDNLKTRFRRLLNRNDELPNDLKILRQDFVLDENIRLNFQNELKQKEELAEKELAWESERCHIALRKLEQCFIDPIGEEMVSVKSFDGRWEVNTFRTIALPSDLDVIRDEIERQKTILGEKLKKVEQSESTDEKGNEVRAGQINESKVSSTKLKGAKAMRVERLLRKMEERAKRRQKRKDEWNALYQRKVPEGYDDPVELENIRYAREHMGNYFLKSASDYVVPLEQRLTVLRALDRIVKLRYATFHYKTDFNRRVFELIDRKRKITDEVNAKLERLKSLGENENIQSELFNFPLLAAVTDGNDHRFQFSREEIHAFRDEHDQRNGELTKPDEGSSSLNTKVSSLKRPVDLRCSVNLREPLEDLSQEKFFAERTPSEVLRNAKSQEKNSLKHRIYFERDRILDEIRTLIEQFDNDLSLLYYLKAIKTLRAKESDLRCITFYEELMLVKEFERTENDLESKVNEAQKRFDNEQVKINEFQGKLDAKRKDIEVLDEKMKQIYSRYDEIIPKEHKFYNYLLRVLNKKIKRKKRVEGDENDDADDMSQDLDDDEDWELEDDDDDDQVANEDPTRQLDVDICPPGLDQKLYDDIVALREKRLDLDEMINDEKIVLQSYQQTLDQTQNNSKKSEFELKTKKNDLIDFQKKKQRKINDLNVAIGIRSHQIRYDHSDHLPDEISEALIFDKLTKNDLSNRIVDVRTEIKKEKERYADKKQNRKDLSHELKHLAEIIKRLTDECNKLMVEKFGKLVQLEKVEGAIVNLQVEELKQRLDDAGDEFYVSMAKYELKKIEEQDDTIDLLRTNTNRLNELTSLVDEKRFLDDQLASRKTKSADEFTNPSKDSVEEFERLCTLVQLQAQEIEALKAEISILSRKGGHILPPNPAVLPQNA